MVLSDRGKTAYGLWVDIHKQFPFVILDEFVVMPNHVHGLIVIDKQDDRGAINRVSMGGGGVTGHSNPMLHQNLSTIIRWYKGRVTHSVREEHRDFMWQTRFHDHIVRNQKSLDKIRNYIQNNPATWKDDKFFSDPS